VARSEINSYVGLLLPREIPWLDPQARVLHRLCDVEHGEAFRDYQQCVRKYRRASGGCNVQRSCRLVEEVFARFQRLLAMEAMPEDETEPAADHAGGLEFSRDPSGGVARPQHHELLPTRA